MAELLFPWEKDIALGKPMPKNLSLAEQEAYQALVFLYERYKLRAIDIETASKEKRYIKRNFDERKKHEEFDLKLCKHRAKIINELEHSITEYKKNKTIENADNIVLVYEGRIESFSLT